MKQPSDRTHKKPVNSAEKTDRQSRSLAEWPCLPFSEDDDSALHFLPASGYRNGTSVNNVGTNGNYWSSTANNTNNAYNLNFNSNNLNPQNNNNRNNGFAVRLVSELPTSCSEGLPFSVSREQLLIDLYQAYKDARIHKRNRPYQIHFEMHLEKNLIALRDEIYERRYKARPSTCFIIHEPKMREVFAADFRDRVVHHLFYNYTHKAFERTFIADTYSCIPGRGTHYGINRLEHHIRSCSQNYTEPCFVLKLDISGYFMHIHRERLLQIATESLRKQKVYNPLTAYLLREIVLLNPVEQCIIIGDPSEWDNLPPSKSLFRSPVGCGLPIGNLTSQLFSNVYLNELDQYCKRELHCRHYGRYVDDMYIVSQDKNELKNIIGRVNEFLTDSLGLALAKSKVRIFDAEQGVPFLGQFLKPYRRYIENQSLRRMKNKIHLAGDRITDAQRASFLGVLSHVSAHNLHVINELIFPTLDNQQFMLKFVSNSW